ncbi:cation-transporting P-type ATPase [Candidatus Uhrbacteria bacterium]|nr:cation-transporting P-type ATPase [Candidatus Uhrbacteria bacterium]
MASMGLTTAESTARLRQHGPNMLPEPRRPGAFAVIVEELRNPILLILVAAAIAAIVIGEHIDGIFIVVTIAVTGGFGVGMALRAERAVRALRKMLTPTARVLRDGREVALPIAELVPDDCVVLAPGARIPADAAVVEAQSLEVDESVLTGESLPVSKSETDALFQGTTVVEGRAIARITATGGATRFASIVASLAAPREDTPLQVQLRRLSGWIAVAMLGLTVATFLIGLVRGVAMGPMLTTAIAVAVAAVPEGLAVAVTAVLAIGSLALSRRRCLVRRLIAAETLGSVSVILTDKTGTITEGHMRAVALRTSARTFDLSSGQLPPILPPDVRACLEAAMLGTDAAIANPTDHPTTWRFLGSGTEGALMVGAAIAGIDVTRIHTTTHRIDRLPFSTERKYSATLVERSDVRELILVGAAERVVAPSAMPSAISAALEQYGGEGFRVIGVATRAVAATIQHIADLGDLTRDATLLGIVALRDPLRMDAAPALAEAQAAGIRTIMVTGDHPATARRIAQDVGLVATTPHVTSGDVIRALSPSELRERIGQFDVYARVRPEDKLRIVRAWREAGAVVAVTGDGVNDAPALIGADVGVAMGSGTDVAKEAADLILLDDRYATIVAGIEGGRAIWDNLRKVTAYLLTSSFSEVVLVGGALALGMPVPVIPAQILWVNLIEDTLPAAALAFEPPEHGVMREVPRRRTASLLSRELRILIFGVGLVSDVVLLVVSAAVLRATGDLALTRTIVFGGLGIDALVYVFGIRDLRHPVWRSRPWSNPWLLVAVGISLLLLIAGLAAPALRPLLRTVALPAWAWALIGGIGIAKLIAVELVKAAARGYRRFAR